MKAYLLAATTAETPAQNLPVLPVPPLESRFVSRQVHDDVPVETRNIFLAGYYLCKNFQFKCLRQMAKKISAGCEPHLAAQPADWLL